MTTQLNIIAACLVSLAGLTFGVMFDGEIAAYVAATIHSGGLLAAMWFILEAAARGVKRMLDRWACRLGGFR